MSNPHPKIGAVTVIGSGIAGIQAALDMAEAGFFVHLVEEKPSVGGMMTALDKTFPTNDCAACMLGPKLTALANHPNIEVLAYTEVLNLEGRAGDFRVTLKKKARAVDAEKCVACGICAQKCPVEVTESINATLHTRKAAFIPYAQALPLIYTIDKYHCRYYKTGKCRICEKVCPSKAILFDQEDEIIYRQTGAVILAGGFSPFDARSKPELGYGRWPNVITSTEYEQILSAAGPFQGHIRRISDQKPPARIAWIQCVGSRDVHAGNQFCSSVCCMSAAKQAVITKTHDAGIDTTIFYIDMRAHGKGFDRFFERSQSQYGVHYVRSMISRVVPNPEDDTLQIAYCDEKQRLQEETFDLVVLSVGLCPNADFVRLMQKLQIPLDEDGFCKTDPLDTTATANPGIFVCGAAQSPKDIPDTVAQAGSAAANAMALLAESRGQRVKRPQLPVEKDTLGEKPRIGVFVCHCGTNIAGVVDVQTVSDYAGTLADVAYATHTMFACAVDQQDEIKAAIKEHNLNRVVVASCTPRTHEDLFRNTLRQAGLNPYLFELANIREQDAWVHADEPEAATEKAKDLVRMSVARARKLVPLQDTAYDVVQRALVIGGGLAGLTAAKDLAKQGFACELVECAGELGGNARHLFYTEDGANPAAHIKRLIQNVESEPLIAVHKNARIDSVSGNCGNFSVQISTTAGAVEIFCGAILAATGAQMYAGEEYRYGRNPHVISQRDLEELIENEPQKAGALKQVVMIQCVGSREPEALYCSRVCCTAAVKNSLKLKQLNPDIEVAVLYRDIRTFGLRETYYLKARKAGVRFFRFEADQKPEAASQGDRLSITVFDQHLQVPVQLDADLLVLSTAIRPRPESKPLAEVLHLPIDEDGFFMEAHPKLRPLDTPSAGIFVCGLAQGPKFAVETVAQAHGAVARALSILSKQKMTAQGMVTHIDPDVCRGCGECEKACLFGAVRLETIDAERKTARVNPIMCNACGACNVACPTRAACLAHFNDDQINAMIESSG